MADKKDKKDTEDKKDKKDKDDDFRKCRRCGIGRYIRKGLCTNKNCAGSLACFGKFPVPPFGWSDPLCKSQASSESPPFGRPPSGVSFAKSPLGVLLPGKSWRSLFGRPPLESSFWKTPSFWEPPFWIRRPPHGSPLVGMLGSVASTKDLYYRRHGAMKEAYTRELVSDLARSVRMGDRPRSSNWRPQVPQWRWPKNRGVKRKWRGSYRLGP